MKKLFSSVVFSLVVMAVIAQSAKSKNIVIDGKIFYAIGTTRLNDFTDFFQLKEKKNLKAAARGYIKTGGAYHATVFTLNEWKT